MGFSTTVNFKSNATFPTNATFPELRFLNVQKLSLPVNTPVGTQVAVTDGFVMSGAGTSEVNAFWTDRGLSGGKRYYNPATSPSDAVTFATVWNLPNLSWDIQNSGGDTIYRSYDDVAYPWLVTTWVASGDGIEPVPTLTHPALQQLTAPATAQGGVFVAGTVANDGIALLVPPVNGKSHYQLLSGLIDVTWCLDLQAEIGATGAGHVAGWGVTTDNGDVYYSFSNVATPDLATNWKNVSDASPASITVTSVTTGQLVSGWKLGSVVYQVNGTQNERNLYRDVLGVAPNIGWDSTKWTDGTTNGSGNTAFPDIGMADPVASEANWTNI